MINVIKHFRLEVNNAFKSYNMPQTGKITSIKKWLGRKGLQFLETLTQKEQKGCNTTEGLFTMLNKSSNHNIMKASNHYSSTK